MKTLEKFIDTFLNSKEKGLQLDIHRGNDEVLIQLFKQSDISNWKIDFEILDPDGYCICIFFNNQKTKNKQNLHRFKNSDFFDDFIFSKALGVDSYFYLSNGTDSVKKTESFCLELIKVVYDYDGQIIYRMNAY